MFLPFLAIQQTGVLHNLQEKHPIFLLIYPYNYKQLEQFGPTLHIACSSNSMVITKLKYRPYISNTHIQSSNRWTIQAGWLELIISHSWIAFTTTNPLKKTWGLRKLPVLSGLLSQSIELGGVSNSSPLRLLQSSLKRSSKRAVGNGFHSRERHSRENKNTHQLQTTTQTRKNAIEWEWEKFQERKKMRE